MAAGSIDYGSDKIATFSFTEGGDEKHTERIAAGAGVYPTSHDDTVTAVVVGLADIFAVTTGKGRIVIGGKADTTLGATFSVRAVYYKNETPAAGEIIGLSAAVILTTTALTDGGTPAKRLSTLAVFANDVGASAVGIYLEAITPNNSVDLTISAM